MTGTLPQRHPAPRSHLFLSIQDDHLVPWYNLGRLIPHICMAILYHNSWKTTISHLHGSLWNLTPSDSKSQAFSALKVSTRPSLQVSHVYIQWLSQPMSYHKNRSSPYSTPPNSDLFTRPSHLHHNESLINFSRLQLSTTPRVNDIFHVSLGLLILVFTAHTSSLLYLANSLGWFFKTLLLPTTVPSAPSQSFHLCKSQRPCSNTMLYLSTILSANAHTQTHTRSGNSFHLPLLS